MPSWLLKQRNPETWKRSWEQLAFNTGAGSLTIFVAGLVYTALVSVVGTEPAWITIPILIVTAIVYDQISLWLVLGIISLQDKNAMQPWVLWRENWWATSLNVAILVIGGGMIAFAASAFGWIGIAIFFLPVLLSAYAFRLYTHQMQAHMDNLESIVADRTHDLAAANASMARLHDEKNAFLAVLAHDMKTPLTTIQLYGQLIQRFPNRVTEKPHMADNILESQAVLSDIVDNIVDLEKLQAGESLNLQLESVDLVHVLVAAVELVRVQAEKKSITITVDLAVPYLRISADTHQLSRALVNLLSNAVKYTPQDGYITATLQQERDRVAVRIVDTGYGIPAEDLPYIFERFSRVQKYRRQVAGTGLGLAITKAIAEAHGGTIEVVSEENVGSTFCLCLPLEPDSAESTQSAAAHAGNTSAQPRFVPTATNIDSTIA
jgi:signal transduction histidine kinase